jgi:hypothetical protein
MPHAKCPHEKFLIEKGRPKAPTPIHSLSGLKFLPLEKTNAFADCPE